MFALTGLAFSHRIILTYTHFVHESFRKLEMFQEL